MEKLAPLLSMAVIARTKKAVYLRLPLELQEQIECSCDHCKKNGGKGAWDTLAVPIVPKDSDDNYGDDNYTWTWRVHMPDPAIDWLNKYLRT